MLRGAVVLLSSNQHGYHWAAWQGPLGKLTCEARDARWRVNHEWRAPALERRRAAEARVLQRWRGFARRLTRAHTRTHLTRTLESARCAGIKLGAVSRGLKPSITPAFVL